MIYCRNFCSLLLIVFLGIKKTIVLFIIGLTVLMGTIILTSCPEGQEIVDDIITEPVDTVIPPTTIAEVKQPEETEASIKQSDEAEKVAEESEKEMMSQETPEEVSQLMPTDDWAITKPRNLDRPSVRLVYFLPNDRPARAELIPPIRQLIKEAQQLYADEMQRHGYGRKTFTVESTVDGMPAVNVVKGGFDENYYDLHSHDAIQESFDHFNDLEDVHAYLILMDLSYEVPLGGTGCGAGGIQKAPGPIDGFSHAFLPASGSCFTLNTLAHELGHAFGLEHNFRDDAYLMSYSRNGNRFSDCAAEWLSVSRFFNEGSFLDNRPGNITRLDKSKRTPQGVRLQFRVADDDGLHQAQLIAPKIDEGRYKGWREFFDCRRLKGVSETITFIYPADANASVKQKLILHIIDKKGGFTRLYVSPDW